MMRNLKTLLIAATCILLQYLGHAQSRFTLSGVVLDEKKLPVPSATVFLSGTLRITATDASGRFTFNELAAGTYLVSVKMISYAPEFRNIMLKQSVTDLKIALKVSPVALRGVVIGGKDPSWDEKYGLFKECFLGLSKNARNCKILNPKSLRLKYKNGKRTLEGHSDDFLIIENAQLGYRIKYLLKIFEYKMNIGITSYGGETSFEEMEGTPQQKAIWAGNRNKIYYGSAMHFFRALYAGGKHPAAEGFKIRSLAEPYDLEDERLNARMRPPAKVDERPVAFDSLVTVVDSSFIALKFHRGLFIDYEPKTNLLKGLEIDENGIASLPFTNDSSILQLGITEAIIDSRGKVMDDLTFLMMGRWGRMRVGDQLPYEYQPIKTSK